MYSENGLQEKSNQAQNLWVGELLRKDGPGSSFKDSMKKVSPLQQNSKAEVTTTMDSSRNPSYWSRICLHNMAKLAKEATTMRRVLDPLFRSFDNGNYWSSEKGIAYSILSEMQVLMEKSEQNSHLLLSLMIKHLDNKNVAKQPDMQIDIVNVSTHLARDLKMQASLAILTAIGDLMRHLRRCMQCSIEASNLGITNKWNHAMHSAIEECLLELAIKVGDLGPILDMMAVVLENIPSSVIVARTTISSVFRTAQITASIPNLSYHKKAFPEGLFHQIILAMAHPDPETRVGSHRVLSAILVPSMVCPWLVPLVSIPKKGYDAQEALVVALSSFTSSGTMLEKMGKDTSFATNDILDMNQNSYTAVEGIREVDCSHDHIDVKRYTVCPSRSDSHSIKLSPSCSVSDREAVTESGKEEFASMRLSSHQLGLLLSSIWAQATSMENSPANYEAMAHTCNLALLFSRAKASNHVALVRCFQLAFSLRSISRDRESCLQPSHRRSLYTFASCMLIFSAKTAEIPELISSIKAGMKDKTVDPYLQLVEDSRLQTSHVSPHQKADYASEEDEVAALKFLEELENNDEQLKEITVSHLVQKFEKLSEDDLIGIKEQILQGFSPEDAFPLGAPLFIDTPYWCSPLAQKECEYFDESMAPFLEDDEDLFPDACGSQSDRKVSESTTSEVISVNQLIESVLETSRQVATIPVSTTPVPYDQMKSQCEALVIGKQQKMSVLLSIKHQQEGSGIAAPLEDESDSSAQEMQTQQLLEEEQKSTGKEPVRRCDSMSSDSEKSFRLPPASPYDKFLKAAGCN
ncbi:uncharacterized protein M6B38_335440 [Iris pallida]|uniref:ARM repeat superfamily protein n=1 Tax=Iris pallida TaxID=29817 RepID=A0AAX6H1E7_IRIPA|nr:uncharacterized protein M6B38_335440 [Iris pallida]